MRGYFGLGVDRISKPMNVGNLFRTAHAFGASFVFAIGGSFDRGRLDAATRRQIGRADTSAFQGHVPFYDYAHPDALQLPQGCALVGVELVADAVDLPSFRHSRAAAYVLGPERDSLDPRLLARCDFTVQIPMRFCVNVGVAGAIVLFDRLISLGRFAPRPVGPGGPDVTLPDHIHGGPVLRRVPVAALAELAEEDPGPGPPGKRRED